MHITYRNSKTKQKASTWSFFFFTGVLESGCSSRLIPALAGIHLVCPSSLILMNEWSTYKIELNSWTVILFTGHCKFYKVTSPVPSFTAASPPLSTTVTSMTQWICWISDSALRILLKLYSPDLRSEAGTPPPPGLLRSGTQQTNSFRKHFSQILPQFPAF